MIAQQDPFKQLIKSKINPASLLFSRLNWNDLVLLHLLKSVETIVVLQITVFDNDVKNVFSEIIVAAYLIILNIHEKKIFKWRDVLDTDERLYMYIVYIYHKTGGDYFLAVTEPAAGVLVLFPLSFSALVDSAVSSF